MKSKKIKSKRLSSKFKLISVAVVVAFFGTFGYGLYTNQNLSNNVQSGLAAGIMPTIPSNHTIPAPDSGKTTRKVGPNETYKTIKSAINASQSGDVIVVRGGVYREGEMAITKKLTIVSQPGEQVWVDGTNVINSSEWVLNSSTGKYEKTWYTPSFCSGWIGTKFNDQYYSWVDGNGNTRIVDGANLSTKSNGVNKKRTLKCAGEDMSLDESNPMAWDPQAVYVDNVNLKQVSSLSQLDNNNEFFYQRSGSSSKLVINFKPSTNQLVEATARPSFLIITQNQTISTSAGSKIIGIGIRKFATNQHSGTTTNGALYVTTSNVQIKNTVLWHNSGTGMAITNTASNVVVSNSIVKDNGFNGFVANQSPNIIVENNQLTYNNREKFGKYCSSSCADAGIKMAHMKGATIRYNLFEYNNGYGYWCDLDCADVKIYGNTFANNLDAGILYEVSTKATIFSNIIANNGSQGIRFCSSYSKIYNNTIIDNAKEGIWVYEDMRIAGEPANPTIADHTNYDSESNEIVNNIYSRNNNLSLRVDAQQLYQKKIEGSTRGKNGTYTHSATKGDPIKYFNPGKLDYNLYQKNGTSNPTNHINWGKVTNTALTTKVSTVSDKPDSNPADTLTITKYNQSVDNRGTTTYFSGVGAFRSQYNQFEANAKESTNINDPLFKNYNSPGSNNNDYRILTSSSLAYNNGMPLPSSIASLISKPSSYQGGRGAITWRDQNMQIVESPVDGGGTSNNSPSAPSNLQANNITETSATLNWSASSDPDGDSITYTVKRSGNVVASNINGTSYGISGLSSSTNYSYSVLAVDSKGAQSPEATTSFSTTGGSGGGGGSITHMEYINPSNDAYIDSAQPTTALGATDPGVLKTDQDPSQQDALLRFNVPEVEGKQVEKAVLKMVVVDDGSKYSSGNVYATSNEVKGSTTTRWYGNSVTWNTAPDAVGSVIASQGPTTGGQTVSFDLSSYYDSPGLKSIRLVGSNAAGTHYSSNEGNYKPVLEISYSDVSSGIEGDMNNDGIVDIVDLSILLSDWDTSASRSDINGDNIVNIVDLSILLSNWSA